MEFLGYLLLCLAMIAALVTIPFGLPGVGLILLAVGIYSVITRFSSAVGLNLFLLFCGLTVVAETADNWLMALGAQKFGASRTAIWLSFLGGLLGTLLFGPLLALVMGLLGPFVGAFLGSFLIVFLYEYRKRGHPREALRAGWGTVLGKTAGIVLKMAIGMGMVLTVMLKIIF